MGRCGHTLNFLPRVESIWCDAPILGADQPCLCSWIFAFISPLQSSIAFLRLDFLFDFLPSFGIHLGFLNTIFYLSPSRLHKQ